METSHYPFPTLPLPYPIDALVPHLDARTLVTHHDKHYKTYVDNLNSLLKNQPALWQLTLKQLLSNPSQLPEDQRTAILRNAGGVYNHILYFACMGPEDSRPVGRMEQKLNDTYGSLDGFYEAMKKEALSLFGSGYVWLLEDGDGNLSITSTPNQDVPDLNRYVPLLTLDMWEHAYYLQYQNRKGDYVDNWFQVIDWSRFPDEEA
jgi:Fe-Mn family superoxide dismutase